MASPNFTENERKLLAAAWSCFETQPKINFEKLATVMGYKNSQSAAACFQPLKKKLLASASAENDGSTPAPTPKKAATAKGKGKGKGKGKRARAESEVEEEDDDELFGVKSKKSKTAEEDAAEEGAAEVKSEGGETE